MARVLELLDARDVRATFFVLGETAEAHPAAISRIARSGHGIASHGYRHVPVDLLGPAAFAADLDRSIAALTACAGRRPEGYRAPIWSLASSPWAFEVLVSRGFRFDSSLAPVPPLGSALLSSRPTLLRRGSGTILELPPLSAAFGPWRYPVGFAMGLRALPTSAIRRAIERENRLGIPAIVALHTWELDPDPPALRLAPALAVAHGFGLEKVPGRLDALLRALPFGSIEESLAEGATLVSPPSGDGELGEAA